ncbi:MAG: hypothetical protein RIS47_1790, partial [Bacteroidota bacterium]
KLYKGSDSPFISTMINARNNGDSLSCDYDGGQLLLYYIHEFRAPKPRTFNEVKGYVLADMQSDREREYLAKLRHEYSIAIQKKSLERYAKSLNQQSK